MKLKINMKNVYGVLIDEFLRNELNKSVIQVMLNIDYENIKSS